MIGTLGGEGRLSASLINALIMLNKQGRFLYHGLIETSPLERVNEQAFEGVGLRRRDQAGAVHAGMKAV